MKAQQSKWILAAIFLLLLTTRENLAQEIGAPPASDDSNSGEAKENYTLVGDTHLGTVDWRL